MKAYYAHCIALYNTPQEQRDVSMLEQLGFTVVNPNCPECDEGYKREGMAYFNQFAVSCDLVAFRALPDGSIPAGVAHEVSEFAKRCKPVIELPSQITRRTLTFEQTREYLREVGQR
jgi:hypothetical protein